MPEARPTLTAHMRMQQQQQYTLLSAELHTGLPMYYDAAHEPPRHTAMCLSTINGVTHRRAQSKWF